MPTLVEIIATWNPIFFTRKCQTILIRSIRCRPPIYIDLHLLNTTSVHPRFSIVSENQPQGLGPVYELKYAFLYGYNGTTFAVPGTSVGVHTGDLEHVTIRVDAGRKMWVSSWAERGRVARRVTSRRGRDGGSVIS